MGKIKTEISPVMNFGETMANLIAIGHDPNAASLLMWEADVLEETFWDAVPNSPAIMFSVSHHCDGARHTFVIKLMWEE